MDLNQWISTLDVGCMIRDILRRLWMVILAMVIGAGCMNLMMELVWTEEYTSSATYAVMSKSGITTTLSNSTAANEAASMMSEILESEVMTNRLRNELGSEVTLGSLSAQVVGETNMLVISATAQTPETAFSMVQLAMENFDDYFSKVDSSAVLQVVSDARVALSPDSTRGTLRYLILGAVMGGGLMVILLLWMHIKADTIQTRFGAKQKLDAQVLVSLPHEKIKPLMTNSAVSFYFRENLYRLRSCIENFAAGHENAVVILVTSVAANEGKSTVAANLALALAEKHQGVLLVDADLRNPTQVDILGEEYAGKRGLGSLLQQENLDVNSITGAIGYQKKTNLRAILERQSDSGALDILSGQRMERLLGLLRRTVKYIVLDTPPIGLFPDSSVLADLADISILVVRQDMVSACDINDATDSLGQGKSAFQGVILNDMRSVTGYGYGFGCNSQYSYGGYGNKTPGRRNTSVRGGDSRE